MEKKSLNQKALPLPLKKRIKVQEVKVKQAILKFKK